MQNNLVLRVVRLTHISKRIIQKEGFKIFLNKFISKLVKKVSYELEDMGDRLKQPISIKLSKFTKRPIYHIIGDSHARILKNRLGFIVHHIGPATAFNLIKSNNTTKSREKILNIIHKNFHEKHFVFVFGEIDCREHIYYQFLKNKKKITIQNLINNTIKNYLDFLIPFKEKNLDILVLGITPASTSHAYYYNFEFSTPLNVRAEINNLFNRTLKQACEDNKIRYINIYPLYKDNKGYLDKKYSSDGTHLVKKTARTIKRLILHPNLF